MVREVDLALMHLHTSLSILKMCGVIVKHGINNNIILPGSVCESSSWPGANMRRTTIEPYPVFG